MKTPIKAVVIAACVVVALLMVAFVYVQIQRASEPAPSGSSSASPMVVRPDSHVLDDGGEGSVTVVEFLDFECEACGAFYPIVEDLREQYAGEITYVVRYFPLPGHANSTNAAIAAEAAAQQGRFEDMYHRLFETQGEWGESQVSRADVFRTYAEDLGLDMDAYDASVADPATAARVEADFADGRALGVSSTPTFFIDGAPVTLQTWDDLEAAIGAAVR